MGSRLTKDKLYQIGEPFLDLCTSILIVISLLAKDVYFMLEHP